MNNFSFPLLSILLFCLFWGSCSNSNPQEDPLLGQWYDAIHIFPEKTSYAAKLTFQNPVDNASVFIKNDNEFPLKLENKSVVFELPEKGLYYHGVLSEDTTLIQGIFVEGRNAFPLEMRYRKSTKGDRTLRDFTGFFSRPLQSQGIRITLDRSFWGAVRGKVDIPGLEVQNIPMNNVTISGNKLSFESERLQLSFVGELNSNGILQGAWSSKTVYLLNQTRATFRKAIKSDLPLPNEYAQMFSKASPEETGLYPNKLSLLLQALNDGTAPFLDGIMLVKNNRLVLERYYNGYTSQTPHALSGISRGITSLLAGIALPDSILNDLQEPISTYLDIPEESDYAAITLHQLMTMSSGFACNDWSRTSFSNRTKMLREKDWTDYMLRVPLADKPGSNWSDCGGNGVLLASIIERATRLPLQTFAAEKLFDPLKIKSARWEHDTFANPDGGSGMFMSAHDLARIGVLLLNKGRANGSQLVPPSWIETIWQKQIDLEADAQSDYGYFWWSKNISYNSKNVKLHYAAGMGGQYLFIIPQYQMVIIFFSSDVRNKQLGKPFELLQNYILPAVVE
ncbi:MAG: serine hydrolase domain-containing protein [Calditrichia bacterium]